jgi:hypothetical protein
MSKKETFKVYKYIKYVVNPIFRVLFMIGWVVMLITFVLSIPIYLIGFIMWKEDSDLFSHIIYDRWFEPILTYLFDGI